MKKKNILKTIITVLITFVLTVALTSFTSSFKKTDIVGFSIATDSYANETAYAKPMNGLSADMKYMTASSQGYGLSDIYDGEIEQKIIVTTNVSLETTEYDKTLEKINQAILNSNGYVQNSNSYKSVSDLRAINLTIRIPADKLNDFMELAKSAGNAISVSYHTEDITDSYYDTEARIKSLNEQEEKLLSFYDEAENIDDLISIESRLSEIQYQRDQKQAQMNRYKTLTQYSTVDISISEVKVLTEDSENFADKMKETFSKALQELKNNAEKLVLFFIFIAPTLLIIVTILIIAILIIKAIRKSKKRKQYKNVNKSTTE